MVSRITIITVMTFVDCAWTWKFISIRADCVDTVVAVTNVWHTIVITTGAYSALKTSNKMMNWKFF